MNGKAGGNVPEKLLAFLRSDDPSRDSEKFWDTLRQWYLDGTVWHADFRGFRFPAGTTWMGYHFAPDADFSDCVFEGETFFGLIQRSLSAKTAAVPILADGNTQAVGESAPPSVFEGLAYFSRAKFDGPVHFGKVLFHGPARFSHTRFVGGSSFFGARFEGYARFAGATFGKTVGQPSGGFAYATFSGSCDFGGATFEGLGDFSAASFRGGADFREARFEEYGQFARAQLRGRVDFSDSSFFGVEFSEAAAQDLLLDRTAVESSLKLGATVLDRGRIELRDIRNRGEETNGERSSPPILHLGPGSANGLVVRSLNATQARWIRLRDLSELEQLSIYDVTWPVKGSGHWLGDEDDLDPKGETGPTAQEVERLYRGLRKNHEDRNDRVGAHKWYFAEMEVGRKYASWWTLKRVARSFYRVTSNYGLSAIRAAAWLAVMGVFAFALFMIPRGWACPTSAATGAGQCVGAGTALRVVILSLFLQPLPSSIHLDSTLSTFIWLITRVFGAAMLFSIGVAFRNQVAR